MKTAISVIASVAPLLIAIVGATWYLGRILPTGDDIAAIREAVAERATATDVARNIAAIREAVEKRAIEADVARDIAAIREAVEQQAVRDAEIAASVKTLADRLDAGLRLNRKYITTTLLCQLTNADGDIEVPGREAPGRGDALLLDTLRGESCRTAVEAIFSDDIPPPLKSLGLDAIFRTADTHRVALHQAVRSSRNRRPVQITAGLVRPPRRHAPPRPETGNACSPEGGSDCSV